MDDNKKLDSLKANPKNPRRIHQHDFAALQKSIDTFGDLAGIVYNVRTQQLVGGHQRQQAFNKLGGENKIVITTRLEQPDDVGTVAYGYIDYKGRQYGYREVDWDADFELAANIAANRIQGEWDMDLLAEADFHLFENNPDLLALTGQKDDEISRLLDNVSGDESTLDPEDEAPEVDEVAVPVSKPGEIYRLGNHRLMCGDSTSQAHTAALMVGRKANMVFTDPPYNIAYTGGGGAKREGIMNDKMSSSNFKKFLEAVCKNLHDYCTGAEYICMSSAELDTLKQAFVSQGGHFQNYIIWAKQNFTLSDSDYQHKYEPIVYGWPKDVVNHYFVGDRDKANVWEDMREVGSSFDGEYTSVKVGPYEVRILGQVEGEVHKKDSKADIWRFDRPTKSEDHPTMKPLALCEEAIMNSSLREGLVLDLFGGSGSTLIAADRVGRTCYMMELDPKYCDVIRKRYAKHIEKETEWEAATPVIEAVGSSQEQPAPATAVQPPAEPAAAPAAAAAPDAQPTAAPGPQA